jgi:hypothetical protein
MKIKIFETCNDSSKDIDEIEDIENKINKFLKKKGRDIIINHIIQSQSGHSHAHLVISIFYDEIEGKGLI